VEACLAHNQEVRWIETTPAYAHLAQLVERKTFNLVAVGSNPTVGIKKKKKKKKIDFSILNGFIIKWFYKVFIAQLVRARVL
jgi:hypothetical protein